MGWSKSSRVVALCCAANFINAADRVIMPIAIVPMADHYNFDMHGQGWILSSFAVGYMSSQVIGGSAARKYGGKVMLTISVLLWSLSTLVTPIFAHSMPALFFFRVLLGIGEGLGLPTIFHIFSHAVSLEERSRAFGYLVAFGSIGQTVAALVLPHLPWKWMFYSFGWLGIAWIVLWSALYTEIRSSDSLEEGFVEPPKVNQNVSWRAFVSHSALWAIYTAHFCMNWSNYIIMQWLPTYMSRSLGADTHHIMFTAFPYFFNSAIGVVSGHCSDALVTKHKWSVLSVRRLMTSLGLLGPGIFLLFFSVMDNMTVAVVLISLTMGLSACNSSGHLSNHAEVAPNHAGITFAVSNTLATIPGILCGPVTAELVIQSHGRWFPVFIIAALMNLTGAMVYLVHSRAAQVL